MSDFNKIMAFQQMMPYLNKEQQDNLATTLGMELQEIERRLVGKNKEDEFILILLFMEVCKSITAFDEGVSQLLKTATSDLLVELQNEKKFMLEIKHTDKERYSISMGNLQKRIDYASKYGLELFFAISIKGYWMLFNAEYLKEKKGKIDISDLMKSKLDEMLDCISYVFPKGLRIKSVYSTDETVKSTGIKFPPYGNMVSYELYYNDRRIFRVKGKNSPYIGYTMILEALQDRLSMDTQIIEQSDNYTVTDSNLNHTGIYLYSKGKIMIHLTFDYKTDEKCTTPGQYLKYHRTFQGFTTRELAEKVGIVPATLVLYENDRHPIKHSTAVALANALGIDRNRLLDKYTAFVDYPYSSLLKKVRQELSLTQMQMAEVIGIGQTSYSGWEREIRVPRRKEYEKILAALKKLKVNVDIYLCHPAST